MAADYQFSIGDILLVVRRRAVILVACFIATFGIVVAVATLLPPTFRSGGIILVESQQIPTDLVQSTVTTIADERIQVIKQRVMTRENLYRIIEQFQLFKDEMGSVTITEMVDQMRGMISVEPVLSNVDQRGRKSQTIAFRVSFEHRSPVTAHRVANELITLFLSENVKARTERANETADFLAREAEKLKAELDAVEGKVASFKQRHGNALPEHLNLRANMLQRTEEELKSVTRDLNSTQEAMRFLDVELTAARNGVTAEAGGSSPALDLERLKTEYRALSAKYQEAHPDLRALRDKIKVAEEAAAQEASNGTKIMTPGALRVAEVQAKINASNARIESLTAQQKNLQQRIRQIEAEIMQTPQNERELAVLMRDHDNVRKKFEEVKAKEVDANMARSLEEESKAERFSLLEPPTIPEQPFKPDRNKIAIYGFFGALASSGGVVVLLEMLSQRIWGAALLTHLVRQPPMAVIPYIRTEAEVANRKKILRRVAIISLGLVLIILGGIHFLYMHLDIVWLKLLARW